MFGPSVCICRPRSLAAIRARLPILLPGTGSEDQSRHRRRNARPNAEPKACFPRVGSAWHMLRPVAEGLLRSGPVRAGNDQDSAGLHSCRSADPRDTRRSRGRVHEGKPPTSARRGQCFMRQQKTHGNSHLHGQGSDLSPLSGACAACLPSQ